MLEPLGESQVLAYLEGLAGRHQIDLVSFEKPEDWADEPRRAAMLARMAEAGIRWHPLRYHRRVPLVSTTYDVARALAVARRVVRERDVEVVHARAYVASVVALRLQRAFGVRFIFDMRAFWPDERVEFGMWRKGGLSYRLFKGLERAFLSRADAVVSLTEAGLIELQKMPHIQARDVRTVVIPTCADLGRFSPPPFPPSGPFVLGYVGNVGGWYRFEPVVEAFAAIRAADPDARLLVVNKGQHDVVWAALEAGGVPRDVVEVVELDVADVPDAVRQMHAAAFFLEPSYAKQASAPTRLAELLGCGVPCLVRGGVGDVGRIVDADRVGVVVHDTDDATVRAAALRLVALAADPDVRERCVATARKRFSLRAGVEAYDMLYHEVGMVAVGDDG